MIRRTLTFLFLFVLMAFVQGCDEPAEKRIASEFTLELFDGRTFTLSKHKGDAVVVKLAATRIKAQEQRIETNRVAQCGVCNSDINSPTLQLQRPRSRMS